MSSRELKCVKIVARDSGCWGERALAPLDKALQFQHGNDRLWAPGQSGISKGEGEIYRGSEGPDSAISHFRVTVHLRTQNSAEMNTSVQTIRATPLVRAKASVILDCNCNFEGT